MADYTQAGPGVRNERINYSCTPDVRRPNAAPSSFRAATVRESGALLFSMTMATGIPTGYLWLHKENTHLRPQSCTAHPLYKPCRRTRRVMAVINATRVQSRHHRVSRLDVPRQRLFRQLARSRFPVPECHAGTLRHNARSRDAREREREGEIEFREGIKARRIKARYFEVT